MNETIDLLVRKLRIRDVVSDEEVAALAAAISRVVRVPADTTIVTEGQVVSNSNLIVSGWAARVKLVDTGRRQITELHFGGDFVDLHGFTLKRLDHEIVALTPCEVALVPHENLVAITERYPHLTRLLWLITTIDASIHRSWMTAQGRMSALQRVAHLLCELYRRLEVVGGVVDGTFPFPLTQEEVGDACGLTPVHVNRMAQQLRADGLVEWKRREVTVLDWERLKALAMFDDTYLNLERFPR